MEQARRGTPNDKQKGENSLECSPWVRGTPVRRSNLHLKRLMYQNNGQCLPPSVLPSYITPPSKVKKKFIIKNPFEPDLINKLHLSAISPTVFTKVPSPMQQSPEFVWNIDELAQIKPATIEESPTLQVHSPDPELEVKAQAAIDRFFKQNQIIPSPWDVKEKENKLCLALDTPNRLLNDTNCNQECSKSVKDAWSQTVLSLPLDLPPNVEEILKPFYTFTQEQNIDNDDVNLSNNSLRRKLFFCHDEGTDSNESFTSLSPVKINESMILSCSPPQSGMFVHGTPLKKPFQNRRQSNGSSIVLSENLSPLNMSPIHDKENMYERIEQCSSFTRLNFTINLNTSGKVEKKAQNFINDYHLSGVSHDKTDAKRIEDNNRLINEVNNDKSKISDSIIMEELPKCINFTDNTVHSNVIFSNNDNNEVNLKILPGNTSFSSESHKQSNIMSGAFEQQINLNSAQDTGYQTRSINSTMHTIDSYNTSVSQKILWNEKVMVSKDNTQLSWRENIRNVFSSTPSKHNKENE